MALQTSFTNKIQEDLQDGYWYQLGIFIFQKFNQICDKQHIAN